MNKQTLVLIVSRNVHSLSLIPPLRVILPMLQLLSPLDVYTSQMVSLQPPLYENLVRSFESQITFHSLQEIIQHVVNLKTGKLRICVIGEEDVSWKTVLNCKRKEIVVDVIGKNAYLPFWTGGIHRNLGDKQMVSAFILDFGINTTLRQVISTSRSKKIEFSANCVCCNKKVKGAFVCSVCCAVYCEQTKKKNIPQCIKCRYQFDMIEV